MLNRSYTNPLGQRFHKLATLLVYNYLLAAHSPYLGNVKNIWAIMVGKTHHGEY